MTDTLADHIGLVTTALCRLAADLEARDAVPGPPKVTHAAPGHCVSIDGEFWHEPGECVGAPMNCTGRCCGPKDEHRLPRAAALRAVEVSRGLAAGALERLVPELSGHDGALSWAGKALVHAAAVRRSDTGPKWVRRIAEEWQAYAERAS